MQFQASGVDLMDVMAGGHLDQNTMGWLGERANTLRANVSNHATNFFNQAVNLYQTISTSDAIQAMRNLVAKKDNSWEVNSIYAATNTEQLQTANLVMQRYIMAEPNLRDLYLNNLTEGYGDTYVNNHGDSIGVNHYDYRRVMDGMLVVNDDSMQFSTFYEDIPEGDRELTLHEKVDILKTWNAVNIALSENEMDPTSPVGNLLG